MRIFFTADTHFGHANIIRYCNRPWFNPATDLNQDGGWISYDVSRRNAQAMDEALVNNWNSVVSDEDFVYHLGDFCFGDWQDAVRYFCRLNGAKIAFLWGNHDKAMTELKMAIRSGKVSARVHDRLIFSGDLRGVQVSGQNIVLCHYAMRTWNRSHHGAWHLYGHSHGTLPDDPNALSLDVGVDVHGYFPISFETVSGFMAKKTFVPIDHHK